MSLLPLEANIYIYIYVYIYIYIWDKAFEMINVHIGASRNGAHWTFLPTRRVGTDGLTKPR